MARLPKPGGDSGSWGSILNDYLSQTLKSDGTLKDNVVTSSALSRDAVDSSALASNSVNEGALATGSGSDGQVLVKDSSTSGGLKWSSPNSASTAPATSTSLGTVQLSGDLAGSATSPTVPKLAEKANLSDVYNKSEVDNVLATKANSADTYTKAQVDAAIEGVTETGTNSYSREQIDTYLSAKADVTELDKYLPSSQKGANNGLATLDASGKVPSSQLPAETAQVNADWNAASGAAQILNKPTFHQISTSGSYNDLTNKPSIPTTLGSLTNVEAASPANGQVLAYNSTAQQWVANTVTSTTISDATTNAKGIIQLAGDLGGTADSPTVPGLVNKADVSALNAKANTDDVYTKTAADSTFVPASQKGINNGVATLDASGKVPASQLPATSAPVTSVAGKTGVVTLTKADVGLSNVDNTSDANKPISTATQAALDGKAATNHTHTIAQVNELQTTLDAKVDDSQIGVANGVASLDASGKVPASQLPASGGTGGTIVTTFDPKVVSALLPFSLALGNRRYARANIVVHGDSTEEGIGASSNDRLRTWPARLAAKLRTSHYMSTETTDPNFVNFMPSCSLSAMHRFGTTTWWGKDNPPAGWTIDQARGPHGYALKATAAGSTLTLSIPTNSNVSHYAIVYRQGTDAASGFTSTLNSTTTSAVSSVGSSVKDGAWTALQTVSGSSASTITITASSDLTMIEGAVFFGNSASANRGVAVYNIAKGGSTALNYLDGWSVNNQTPSIESGVQCLIDMNPDLIIRGGFYNDMRFSQGYSAAIFKQYEAQLIANMRAVSPNKTIPILLLTKWKPADSFLQSATSYNRFWEEYVAVRDEIAAADPYCLHLKLDSVFPRPMSTQASAMSIGYSDDVHGSDRAYGSVADLVAQYIANPRWQ